MVVHNVNFHLNDEPNATFDVTPGKHSECLRIRSSDGLNEIALWLTESQLASLAHACYVRDMDRYAETHAGDYGQGDDFVCPTDCTCGHCIGRDAVG